MNNMQEKISNDLKEAMKSGDKIKLSVLRMLKSALQLEAINEKKDLSDEEVMVVIKKNVKQRKDSIAEFEKYNKQEEIANLEKEIEILDSYLPEQLSEEQIDKEINKVFEEINPTSMKDMGKMMKVLTERIGTVADMSLVSKNVKDRLMNVK